MNTRVCMSCLSVLLLGMTIFGSSDAASDTALPVKLDSTGFTEVLARSGDVYIAGQPTEDALKKLQAEGVTTVVNLRTDAEMNNRQGVPYDERAAVAALGMTYIHLPQGGPDTPYSPATVAALAQAIDDN
ncbi:MAG: sulfur transferase domain-containing protein, partial [Proteobacteria bacterium]|nr:sulfur transferase domain-containing protein [Pseudomonadota bacterium]